MVKCATQESLRQIRLRAYKHQLHPTDLKQNSYLCCATSTGLSLKIAELRRIRTSRNWYDPDHGGTVGASVTNTEE